jgi:hypothetical protein
MLHLFLITLIVLSSLSISSALASGGPSGYEYEMSLDQAEYRPGDTYCGGGDDRESQYYQLLSPLQQLKLGTPSQYVVCGQALELALKASNGQPVCVKPETKQMLLSVKWAEPARIMG